MKEFSQELIEINGVDYTLFLNRKVIVAWEKFCKGINEQLQDLREKYQNVIIEDDIEITDETNPFEGLEGLDDLESDEALISTSYKRLYWLMLYTNHKLSETKSNELYEQACKEYGEANLIELANQMIEDANRDRVTQQQELKNLKALRPKK